MRMMITKLLPLTLLILICYIGLVSATAAINQSSPLNASTVTTSSAVAFQFNVTGNASDYTCRLNVSSTSLTSGWEVKSTPTFVSNATPTTLTAILLPNGETWYMIDCTSTDGTEVGASLIFNYSMNVGAPTVTLNTPTNGSTEVDSTSQRYNFTVSGILDTFTCEINTTTGGQDGTYTSVKTITGVLNNTATLSSPGIQTANGDINWRVVCYNPLDSDIDTGTSGRFNYTINVASPTVTQNLPSDRSFTQSNSVTFNWTVSGAGDTYDCDLWTDEDNTWQTVLTATTINNGSSTAKTRNGVLENNITWNVNCTDNDNTPLGAVSGNRSFIVDLTDPVVSINKPSDNLWYSANETNISLTVIDDNPLECILLTTMNSSSNDTDTRGFGNEVNQSSYTNNTAFSFVGFGAGSTSNFGDDGTGAYVWNYNCSDSSGRGTVLSSNRTLFIDTVAPSTFGFIQLLTSPGKQNLSNMSVSSDYTPELTWGSTTELNFSRYEVTFYTDLTKQTVGVTNNVTTRTLVQTNISTLSANTAYFIDITAYDEAGNSINATGADWQYNTTSICHDLNDGWNICGNLGNNRVLSAYLNDTDASVVAYFNDTNQFETYVLGGDGGDVTVPGGQPVFFFMGSVDIWEDSVHNFTATLNCENSQETDCVVGGIQSSLVSVLRNTTNTDWNPEVVLNPNLVTTFQQLDYDLNGNSSHIGSTLNITFFSKYNNSASIGSKYTTYVSNISFNNDTSVNFGDTIWFFFGDINSVNRSINWSDINGSIRQ